MAGSDVSSEEFVEDDSGEEDEEQEESEFDEQAGDSEGGEQDEEEDDFETPRKTKKPKELTSRNKTASETSDAATISPSTTKSPGRATAPKSSSSSRSTVSPTRTHELVKSSSASGSATKGKGRASMKTEADILKTSQGSDGSGTSGSGNNELSGSVRGSLESQGPAIPATPDSASKASDNSVSQEQHSADKENLLPDHGDDNGPKKESSGAGKVKTPKAAVSDYMMQANRPYSCINVFDNLHKKIPKAMVQKLLDELVKEKSLKLQEYGKSKIYYANQDMLPNGAGDVSDEKLQGLEEEAKKLRSELEAVTAQAREAQSRVQSLTSQPTDEDLEKKLKTTDEEVERLTSQNNAIKDQGNKADAGTLKKARTEFNKYRALWISRKRSAMEVIDMIADGMEKKPKFIMEEVVGIESDEQPIPAKK